MFGLGRKTRERKAIEIPVLSSLNGKERKKNGINFKIKRQNINSLHFKFDACVLDSKSPSIVFLAWIASIKHFI